MSGLMARVAMAAEARAERLRERVRARIAAALPGATVRREGDRIVARGRGLVRRWVARDDLRDFREMEP
ncbi:hypothetical protein LWE61_19135 [Sphingobium sufflavum]|uniref:hypothetical protein n=1 Tax=Sphingobium sufflavum TaxID=1129547 RepID=UPI001F39DA30|nr:hypothetical protein [Sphingobium sufflavum]MCE7798650.1 hypothetical protein [Sphingobium sufflavum]